MFVNCYDELLDVSYKGNTNIPLIYKDFKRKYPEVIGKYYHGM